MQKPFTYSPTHKTARDFSLSRRELSIIAFVGAVMLLTIGFALIDAQYGGRDTNSISSSDEFSSGMPLP